MENKPLSSLVLSLGKALSVMPPTSCGTQVAGPRSLPVAVAQNDKRLLVELHELMRKEEKE